MRDARLSIRHYAVAFAVCFIALPVWALPPDLPDWPRPPTESDCRAFQSAITDYYQRADRDYQACYRGNVSCGDAPARRGAASVRRTTVYSCFYQANQRSVAQDVIASAQENPDKRVQKIADLSSRAHEKYEQIKEYAGLKDDVLGYGNLDQSKRVQLHTKLASKLNGYINKNELSSQLTDDALKYLETKHLDAVAQLDRRLKEVTSEHRAIINRRDSILDLTSRGVMQHVRTSAAASLNADERADLRAEIIERRATNAEIVRQREENARRQAARLAAARAEAEREAEEDFNRRQQEAEVMTGILQGLGAAAAGRRAAPMAVPAPAPSYGGGGGSGRSGSAGGLNCRPGESIQRCIHR